MSSTTLVNGCKPVRDTEAAQSSRQPQSSFRSLDGSLMGKVKTDSDIRYKSPSYSYLLNLHVFIYPLCGGGGGRLWKSEENVWESVLASAM